jgi:hypothetical protein
MNFVKLFRNTKKINDLRDRLCDGFYDVDYVDCAKNDLNADLIQDNLNMQLKSDLLDAFGLKKGKKADKIWNIAWDFQNTDFDGRDSIVDVMYKLSPLF